MYLIQENIMANKDVSLIGISMQCMYNYVVVIIVYLCMASVLSVNNLLVFTAV